MKLKFALFTLWFVGSLAGLHALMDYSAQAGGVAAVHESWPQGSSLPRSSKKHLVLFVHPGCSCTKATLSEFSRLMSRPLAKDLTAEVVFMKTPKLEALFSENPLVKKASRVPRTTISFDPGGEEAKLFGAETSGMSYLYGEGGNLLFAGGLTMARGHEGRSTGIDAVEDHLSNKIGRRIAAVFGCDIFDEEKFLTWK